MSWTWQTKEDVLDDIATMTGRTANGIDHDFFLCGEGPPPPLAYEEDETQLQYYGVQKHALQDDNHVEPDLHGIVKMIEMVKHYENNVEYKEKTKPKEAIIISKLNPNVEEFKPKSYNLPNNAKVNEVANNDTSPDNSQIPIDKEREDTIKQLKTKINNVSQSDTFHQKRDRNLAIASLMKLYASNATSKPEDNTHKLMTPDYFEKSINKNNILDEEKVLTEQMPLKSVSPTLNKNSIYQCEMESETLSKDETPVFISDIEIQNSIRKVNTWLNKPPKEEKAPLVYLGQVAFKRKDKDAVSSKSSMGTVEKVAKSTTDHCVQYKPSKYADDLGKMYLERSKLKESLEQNIWTKLQTALKARDEVIKNRLKQKESE